MAVTGNRGRRASMAVFVAVATSGACAAAVDRAFAEFQIQEAGIEKGETELEYRGAYHWGRAAGDR
jgi:hypothetical protein